LADGFFSFSAFLVFLGLLVGTGSMGVVFSHCCKEREDERYLRKREREEWKKNKIKNRLKTIFKSNRHVK
jgi:hypothetical protein